MAAVEIHYDATCPMCTRLVEFASTHAKRDRFVLAPLEATCGENATCADSVVVVIDGRRYERSDAVIAVARLLKRPWRAGGTLRILPRPLRDAAYLFVAHHRHAWFGNKRD